MKLYFFKDQGGNFGDDLNPWLFGQLFPQLLDDNANDLLVGIGTLLNHRIPAAEKVTVFGSGHGYGRLPAMTPDWSFYCVRGPGTAKALGLDLALAITDPAMLAPLFEMRHPEKKFRVSYMPHCDSAQLGDWQHICNLAGVNLIDPRQHFLDVFLQIKQSEHLITEAMHGAILADAFRVPWTPAKAYPHISEFKWQDWLDSVQVSASFQPLLPVYRGDTLYSTKDALKHKTKRALAALSIWHESWQAPPPAQSSLRVMEESAAALAAIASSAQGYLSSDTLLADNTERLLAKAQLLRQHHER